MTYSEKLVSSMCDEVRKAVRHQTLLHAPLTAEDILGYASPYEINRALQMLTDRYFNIDPEWADCPRCGHKHDHDWCLCHQCGHDSCGPNDDEEEAKS